MNQPLKGRRLCAVVLINDHEFGRCPLATAVPPALWPVLGRRAVTLVLHRLAAEGIDSAIVCGPAHAEPLVEWPSNMTARYICEQLPLGTGGCLREAAECVPADLYFVCSAAAADVPALATILSTHAAGGCDLTAIAPSDGQCSVAAAYVCSRTVADMVPPEGFCDIKESLMPLLLKTGRKIGFAVDPRSALTFRDRPGYLLALARMLTAGSDDPQQAVMVSDSAAVHPEARLLGPVVVMDNASIDSGAVIIGPAILGSHSIIGRDSLIRDSILWPGSSVGPAASLSSCVLCENVSVPASAKIQDRAVLKSIRLSPRLLGARNALAAAIERVLPEPIDGTSRSLPRPWITAGAMLLAITAILLAYSGTIAALWDIWRWSDEYSSGMLVPVLAVFILWTRRQPLLQCKTSPGWPALTILFASLLVRIAGIFFGMEWLEMASMLLALWAVTSLILGWAFFKNAFPALIFLFLMLPLPNRIKPYVTEPLQHLATGSAVFALDLLGLEPVRQGNIIRIGQTRVAIAESCNGLRMLTAFIVVCATVVMLVDRSRLQKTIILISAIPIALACNALRLAVTSIAFTFIEGKKWENAFHDFGGMAMMPVAVAMIVVELKLLKTLTSQPETQNAAHHQRKMLLRKVS